MGKAYSGLLNKIDYMTNKLKSLIMKGEDNRIIVKREIILDVSF